MRSAEQAAAFQDALLEALSGASDARSALARLAADPRAEPFRDYVEIMEPRMVEVSIALMQKWAVRDPKP